MTNSQHTRTKGYVNQRDVNDRRGKIGGQAQHKIAQIKKGHRSDPICRNTMFHLIIAGDKPSGLLKTQRKTVFTALPISAKLRTVFTPAASSAANFSSAVPFPPAIIAPACPIRLPLGAVTPAM